MPAEFSLHQITNTYLAALWSSMELDPQQLDSPQTLIRSEPDRVESDMAVAYHLGPLTVIRTDPALADDVQELVSPDETLDAERFKAWATERGWLFIDGGDQHLIDSSGLRVAPIPAGAELQDLDRENADHRSLIADFVARNDPEDVEEAEVELDNLDPLIIGLVDGTGAVRAMASGRVWDDEESFDDIGVLVDDELRGQGWGAAVVSALCQASFAAGRLPLYRCNWSRTASKALAMSLGFTLVAQVSAVGPESAN